MDGVRYAFSLSEGGHEHLAGPPAYGVQPMNEEPITGLSAQVVLALVAFAAIALAVVIGA